MKPLVGGKAQMKDARVFDDDYLIAKFAKILQCIEYSESPSLLKGVVYNSGDGSLK